MNDEKEQPIYTLSFVNIMKVNLMFPVSAVMCMSCAISCCCSVAQSTAAAEHCPWQLHTTAAVAGNGSSTHSTSQYTHCVLTEALWTVLHLSTCLHVCCVIAGGAKLPGKREGGLEFPRVCLCETRLALART